jgi:hypothetical protein
VFALLYDDRNFLTCSKIQVFFFVRLVLGYASAYTEASLYQSIVDHVDPTVGNITLILLIFSAGMFHSAVGNQYGLLLPFSLSHFIFPQHIYRRPLQCIA